MGRFLWIALLVLAPAAHAQSGFFSGGFSDGAAESRRLDLQERALELDARDGGSRYRHLRQQHDMDAIQRQLRANQEFLEQLSRAERERRVLRGY